MTDPGQQLSILEVTFGLPWPPDSGFRQRDFFLLRHSARHNNIHLLCLCDADRPLPDIAPLQDLCRHIELFPINLKIDKTIFRSMWSRWLAGDPLATAPYFSDQMFARIHQLLLSEKFDILQIEHSFLVPFRKAVPKSFTGRTILALHNIGAVQYRRMVNLSFPFLTRALFGIKSLLMRNWEVRCAALFDSVVVVSESEAEWLRQRNPDLPVAVIDNGVDITGTPYLPVTEVGPNLLFVGSMVYPPNEDAMRYFCRTIWPLVKTAIPAVQLWIVGHEPSPALQQLGRDASIHIIGTVADLAPHYANTKLVIVPLRAGSGSRLKILEAMAMGRAVVSTSIGCEGLVLEHDIHLAIADTPSDFSDAIVALINDEQRRSRMVDQARRWVEERYDWPCLGEKLVSLYHNVLGD
jgi:glycosyltransferase involved in cell wall biosynthesis